MSSTHFSHSSIAFSSYHMHPLTSINHSPLHTNSTTPLPFAFHLSRSPPSHVLHLTCHVSALSPRVSFSHLVQGRSIQHIFTVSLAVSLTPYLPLKHPPISFSLYCLSSCLSRTLCLHPKITSSFPTSHWLLHSLTVSHAPPSYLESFSESKGSAC